MSLHLFCPVESQWETNEEKLRSWQGYRCSAAMAPWFSYRHRQMGTGAVTESADGFWGKVTASLDWCEGNYEISYYIAEFWNTVSNVSFLLPSLFAAWYVWRMGYAPRFVLAHLSVALIGLGSTLFHMTLKYTMQLADELPMLYGTAALLYCVIELPKARSEVSILVLQPVSHWGRMGWLRSLLAIGDHMPAQMEQLF